MDLSREMLLDVKLDVKDVKNDALKVCKKIGGGTKIGNLVELSRFKCFFFFK